MNPSIDSRGILQFIWDELMRLLGEKLQIFATALEEWINTLLQKPLPPNWREQLAQFLAIWDAEGYEVLPEHVRGLENWIEAWARLRRLVPPEGEAKQPPRVQLAVQARDAQTVDKPVHCDQQPTIDKVAEAERKLDAGMRLRSWQFAANEQKRIALTDDEREQLASHLYRNFRHHLRDEPLEPVPEFWLNKNSARYLQELEAERHGAVIKRSTWTDKDWSRAERDDKLNHPERTEAGEFRVLLAESRAEAKRAYYDDPRWNFFTRFWDQSLNPGWNGTGTFEDYLSVVGPFAGADPAGLNRPNQTRAPAVRLAPRGGPPEGRKPPFPPPVAEIRARNRKGKDSPHPSHVIAEKSEEAIARKIHDLPDDVVILWGKPIGTHGPDVISYNLKTQTITLWDDKFRGDPVTVKPSTTFARGSRSLAASLKEAEEAIDNSLLSPADKLAARHSIRNNTFETRTHGAGNTKNSTFGDHR